MDLTKELIKQVDNNNHIKCSQIYHTPEFSDIIKWDKVWNYLNSYTCEYNSNHMNIVGYTYFNGKGVEKDLEKGFEWYLKAANAGNSSGMTDVGYAYQKGQGVEQHLKKGFEWYLKAANAGDLTGMNNVGYAYQKGQGVEQHLKKAFEWYLKSAEKGCINAMCNLGFIYKKGIGVERDLLVSAQWYLKAEENGETNVRSWIEWEDYALNLRIENIKLKKEILELSLRPPNIGGPEYEKAKKRYTSNSEE